MKSVTTLMCALLAVAAHLQSGFAQVVPTLQLQAGDGQTATRASKSLSPTGALMASVDGGGAIKLFETQGGRLVCTLSRPSLDGQVQPMASTIGYSGTVGGATLAWSADGTKLLSSLGGDQLAVWDLRHCGQYTLLSLRDKPPLNGTQGEVKIDRAHVRFLGTLTGNKVLVQTDTSLEVVRPFESAGAMTREASLTERAVDIGQVVAHSEEGRIVVLSHGTKGELSVLDRQANVVSALSSYAGQDKVVRADQGVLGAMPPLPPRRPFALSRTGRWLLVKSTTDASILIYDTARRALVSSAPLTGPTSASVREMDTMAKGSSSPALASMLAAAKIDAGVMGLAFSSDEKHVYVLREGESFGQSPMGLEVRSVPDMNAKVSHVLPVMSAEVRAVHQLLVSGQAGSELLLVPVPGTYRSDIVSLRLKPGAPTTDVWSIEGHGPVSSLAFGQQGWLVSRASPTRAAVAPSMAFAMAGSNISDQAKSDLLRLRNQWFQLQTDAWSTEQSRPTQVLAQYTASPGLGHSNFSEDGQYQAMYSSRVTGKPAPPMVADLSLWRTKDSQRLWTRQIGASGRLSGPLAVSPAGALVATVMQDVQTASAQLTLLDGRSGNNVASLALPGLGSPRLSFSRDGRTLYILDDYGLTGECDVTNPKAPAMTWAKERSADQFPLGFLPGSSRLVMPVLPEWIAADKSAYAVSTFGGWQNVLRIPVKRLRGTAVANADESLLAVAQEDRVIRLIDISSAPKVLAEMVGMTTSVSTMVFSPDGRYLVVGDDQGGVWLWGVAAQKLLARMYTFEGGDWVVIDPEGRFDTNNLEGMKHLHWVMPDEPFRAYPLELFMRQYFQPQLLERIMSRTAMQAVPSVATVSRAQPEVRITDVVSQVGHPDKADVTVHVRSTADFKGRSGGAADLRLFRAGQLVAMASLKDPISMAQLQGGREATVHFKGIRLPSDARNVTFTAYAFNSDQVKSATASIVLDRPKLSAGVVPHRRAFVVSMGVNVHDVPDWNLSFAANDALKTQAVLSERLKATGLYGEVIALPLVSDGKSSLASKANLRAVLMALSGQAPNAAQLANVPGADRLTAATPDDVVLLTFAGHGYSDAGEFYLVPQDIGSSKQVSTAGKAHSISSAELSEWILGIDAADLSMVIDACHSAAAVQSGEFKPGPMGAKGLGQLAYDKGMRILAATQADDVALESGQLRQGLLTFALVSEGLGMGKADYQPTDKKIDVTEWMTFGAQRVPEIYGDILAGRTVQESGRGAWKAQARGASRAGAFKPKVQKPTLFDFRAGQPAFVMSVLE